MHYPTITDEKLEELLGIWNTLVASNYRKMLDITLTLEYKPQLFSEIWTLAYGEEARELTWAQASRVQDWLESLPGSH